MSGYSRFERRRPRSISPAVGGAGSGLVALLVTAMAVSSAAMGASIRPSHVIRLVASCAAGNAPGWFGIAYDPLNHDIYIPNWASGTVTVLNGSCGRVKTIALPGSTVPTSATFDPGNGYVYIGDQSQGGLSPHDYVYVINNTKVIATLNHGFNNAEFMTYDPLTKMMIVCNDQNNNLTAIYNNLTVSSLHTGVGNLPVAMVYDPHFRVLIVANMGTSTPGSANLTIINASAPFSSTAHGNVRNVSGLQMVYDPHDGLDYVADGSVYELLGNGTLVATKHLRAGAYGIAYDSRNDRIYVAAGGGMTEFSGTKTFANLSFAGSSVDLTTMTFDASTGDVVVVGHNSDRAYFLD